MDRKNTEELMEMLGLKETWDRMAKANGVRWYGHVIKRVKHFQRNGVPSTGCKVYSFAGSPGSYQ